MCSVALLWLWNCDSTWKSFAPPTFRYLDTFSSSFSFSLLTWCTDFLHKFVKRVQSVCFFLQFHVSFIHFLNWFHCEFVLFFNWAIVWAAWPPIVVMHRLGHRCCCLFWYYSYSKYNLVAIVFFCSSYLLCCFDRKWNIFSLARGKKKFKTNFFVHSDTYSTNNRIENQTAQSSSQDNDGPE